MTPLWTQPQPLPVAADAQGRPLSFHWGRRDHGVVGLSRHWRVHLDWWTPDELWRDYWEVATDSDLLCVIYRDLISGTWALERIYP